MVNTYLSLCAALTAYDCDATAHHDDATREAIARIDLALRDLEQHYDALGYVGYTMSPDTVRVYHEEAI